jgi:hypothetical protein
MFSPLIGRKMAHALLFEKYSTNMWTRFWLMISTLWLLFCLHGGSLERTIQGFWLALGLVGFALWFVGRWLSVVVGRFLRSRRRMKPR